MVDDRDFSFAEQLRRLRLSAGLSQEELANRAGLSAKAISKLERGERRRPYPRTVRKLATALQLELEKDQLATLVRAARGFGEKARGGGAFTRGTVLSAPVAGFLGAVPAGPLVGRRAELAAALRALDEAKAGAGRFLVLTGEPGVGKTRLAQELALQLERRDFLVLNGRCYETEQAVPFSPLLDALSAAQSVAPAGVRAAIPTRWPDLARLLRGGEQPRFLKLAADAEESPRLLRAVGGFLEALSEWSPLAILVDDLHWADESTLRLLQYLARHTRNRRVLLVGTMRSINRRPDQPLALAMVDLNREGLTEEVHLADFAPEETARLVDVLVGRTDPAFADWVQRLTDGNPFFVQELVRSLIDRGALVQRGERWEWEDVAPVEVPASVRALIGQRVARLTSTTQALLRQASVLGQTFEFDLVRAIGDWSEAVVEDALDDGVAAGLVRWVKDDDFAFDHALTQQALYAELAERHRRRLHRRAGEALEVRAAREQGKHAAGLARHFLKGHAPERALIWSMRAGDEAEDVFAHPEAERHYRQALDLAQATGDVQRLAEARQKLGAVLTIVARYDEAIALLEPAAAVYVANGDAERLAATLSPFLWAHSFRGTPAEGMARVEPLLPMFEAAVPSPALALFHVKLATLFHFAARYDAQLGSGQRAADVATQVGDNRVLGEAEDVRGYALCLLGRLEEGLTILDRARMLAESTGHLVALANVLGHLAISHLLHGSFDAGGQEAEEAVAAARRLGDPQLAMIWTPLIAMHRLLIGKWEDARQQLAGAMPRGGESAAGVELPYPLFTLGWLELLEGNGTRATSLLERSLHAARLTGHLQAQRYATQFLAQLDVANGDPEQAVARLTPLLDRPGLEEQDVTTFLPCLAWAHVAAGDLRLAQRLATSTMERARRQHHALALVDSLCVLGMTLVRQGHWSEAKGALAEGQTLAHSLPYPYAEALLLYEQGILHRQRAEPDQARERFAVALAMFRKLGARRDAEHAQRALGQLADGT